MRPENAFERIRHIITCIQKDHGLWTWLLRYVKIITTFCATRQFCTLDNFWRHRVMPFLHRCHAAGSGARYCEDRLSVCLPLCLSVCPVAYLKNHCPNFTTFSIHVIRGRGSVLLWQQCNVLCTSGLADDAMFDHRQLHGSSKIFLNARRNSMLKMV